MAAVITSTSRLTKDATQRRAGESTVTSFSIAEQVWNRDKRANDPLYYDCSWFGGKQADSLLPLLKKGTMVTVTGEHSIREYQGKQYQQIDVKICGLRGGGKSSGATQDAHSEAKSNGYEPGRASPDEGFPF